MKKQLTHFIKLIAGLTVIFLVLINFQSNLYFKHAHQLSDGSVIEHAHPFSKDGGQHEHNKEEITFLSLLNPHVDLVQEFSCLDIASNDLFVLSIDLECEVIINLQQSNNLLRGPPSC